MIIGVVGKPNCGKSTFFKAATLADILIANYPFATIKANTGIGHVSTPCADTHFSVQCNPRYGQCIEHRRFIPVEIIDVAGLVPGAHEGKGMGNQFLDDLRQADVLIHVIDASGSTNERGEPVDRGTYDPVNDVRFLEDELDHWYAGILAKGWERFARTVSVASKKIEDELARQLSGLGVSIEHVKEAMRELELGTDPSSWDETSRFKLARALRTKTKPIIIAANKADVPSAQANLTRFTQEFPEERIIPVSAESELALREAARAGLITYIPGNNHFSIRGELSEPQQRALEIIRGVLERYGSTGVQDVLDQAVFSVLEYIAVYPGGVSKLEDSEGNVLPDCFLLPKQSTALDFAYRLHTDFGKNFIKAIDVKTRMPIGKEHPLKNGDVIEIVTRK